MSASLFADFYIPYEYKNNSTGEHLENTKTFGDLKEGDILYYQSGTYIGKAYIRYYPLHTRKRDDNGIINNFKIIVTYVFTKENGKETRYKRDLCFGNINYEEFKNRTFSTYNGNYNTWNVEVYSPDIKCLKNIIIDKSQKYLKQLKNQIEETQKNISNEILKIEKEVQKIKEET